MSAVAQLKPDYTYWQNALAGTFGAVHDSDPQPGFYRKRTGRSAGYVPVAIWLAAEGGMLALVDGKAADAAEIWTYVCQYPILEEWYRAKMDGQPWPDEDKSVSQSLAHDLKNSAADPAAALTDQIDAALAGMADYDSIGSDEVAAKAQSLRSRLLELSGEADKTRENEKRPHLEAGRNIDAKWQPLVKKAKEAADKIRAALGAHETRKARAAEAARQEAEGVRLAAEAEAARLRAEAEAAAREAEQAGKPAPVVVPVPEPAPAPAPAPVPETATAIRGAYGRAAAVKVVKVARVVDQDKAYMAMRTHKELVETIAKLAQRAATAGVEVAGVEVTEERAVA